MIVKSLAKTVNCKQILLRKRFFCSQSLNIASSIIDLKGERRVWTFYRGKLWFQHMSNNRNNLAVRQQFRADFRMTPDTFMDTFTLVMNSLEKQDTRFSESFPIERREAIAFRISHQRCSMKKGLRPATLLKRRLQQSVLM